MFGIDKCPLCGSKNLIYKRNTGEVICTNCGYVVKIANIDMGPEWRSFEGDFNKARTGPPHSPLIPDRGMGTILGQINVPRNYKDYKVSESRRREIRRIKMWSRRLGENAEGRNLNRALTLLQNYADKLDAPKNAVKRAAEIYRKALKRDLVRGRAINLLVAASLYLALRELQNPRSLNTISKKTGLRRKEVARYYRMIIKELNIKPPQADPAIYVRPIALRLNLPGEIIVSAENIIGELKRMRVTSGKDPIGLATAAIYIACKQMNYDITHKEIVKVVDITEVTIRNRVREIKKHLEFIKGYLIE